MNEYINKDKKKKRIISLLTLIPR